MTEWKKSLDDVDKLTAGDWQAYTSMDGVDNETAAINKQFKDYLTWARRKITGEDFIDPVKVGQYVYEEMSPFLSKGAFFGFSDTEPRCMLCIFIERFLDLPRNSISR